MNCNNKIITTSLLWAAAILSAALLGASSFLTLIILPVLGFFSITALRKQNSQ